VQSLLQTSALSSGQDRACADLPPDPRHTQLGARGPVRLEPTEEGAAPYSGNLLGVSLATRGDYTALRYSLGIAEAPNEMPSGALLAHAASARRLAAAPFSLDLLCTA
jgi:hypothetical protein